MANILLGVTGGIAAYKAAGLINPLINSGHTVRVVMTANAVKFIAPVTFQALSGNKVYVDDFTDEESALNHIELARWADLVAVAPLTANTLAKIANGIADNLLTSLILASTKPVVLFPAMNNNMYANIATQENVKKALNHGLYVVEPAHGRLACGDTAKGKFPDTDVVLRNIERALKEGISSNTRPLSGLKVLVGAGPTVEKVDAVRYISNYSSGKMGYAIADVAQDMGAEVCLVSGPVGLKSSVENVVKVSSAAEMLQAVEANVAEADIFIMAAAVADYTVKNPESEKMKKTGEALNIELTPTADILKTVAIEKRDTQIFAGFAAESQNLLEYAGRKLKEKKLDMIVANDISRKDIGFNVDENEVSIIDSEGVVTQVAKMRKTELATLILAHAHRKYQEKQNKL